MVADDDTPADGAAQTLDLLASDLLASDPEPSEVTPLADRVATPETSLLATGHVEERSVATGNQRMRTVVNTTTGANEKVTELRGQLSRIKTEAKLVNRLLRLLEEENRLCQEIKQLEEA